MIRVISGNGSKTSLKYNHAHLRMELLAESMNFDILLVSCGRCLVLMLQLLDGLYQSDGAFCSQDG